MDELLKELGIYNIEGIKETSDEEDSKTLIFKDSDDYSKAYTILDNSDLVELDPDNVLLNEDISQLIYYSDKFEIKLIANFEEDTYKLIIKEE